MQQMSNKNQEQKARSKSKKKGIHVSLTPSKIQKSEDKSQYEISRVTVTPINELPLFNYQLNNSIHNPKVKFIYQSPAASVYSRSNVQSQWVIPQERKMQNKQLHAVQRMQTYHGGIPVHQERTVQLHEERRQVNAVRTPNTNMSSPQKVNTPQKQQISQIRTKVFTVVEQINEKINKKSPQPREQQNIKQKLNKQLINNKVLTTKIESKSKQPNISSKVDKKIASVQPLQPILQKTIQASQSLQAFNNDRILQAIQQNNLNNHTNQNEKNYRNQNNRKPNIERLKEAEKKLLNIIKVCDYGL